MSVSEMRGSEMKLPDVSPLVRAALASYRRHSGARYLARTSDVQLHIGESRGDGPGDSGFLLRRPRNDGSIVRVRTLDCCCRSHADLSESHSSLWDTSAHFSGALLHVGHAEFVPASIERIPESLCWQLGHTRAERQARILPQPRSGARVGTCVDSINAARRRVRARQPRLTITIEGTDSNG